MSTLLLISWILFWRIVLHYLEQKGQEGSIDAWPAVFVAMCLGVLPFAVVYAGYVEKTTLNVIVSIFAFIYFPLITTKIEQNMED